MEVSASISYIINPEASTSVCGSSSQDANACFEVYGTTQGNIDVYAFWQSRKFSCKWLNCKVILTVIINSKIIFLFSLTYSLLVHIQGSWSEENKVSALSHTWSLANTRKKLFGLCYACDCHGTHFLNVLCKGSQYGASHCSCSTRMSK